MLVRIDDRRLDQIRPIKIMYNVFGYAPGSVLLQMGNTKVLCAATLENSVPNFIKGTNSGWLSAEYSLLPTSTHQRKSRESSSFKRDNRSIEISRLIGRSMRSIVSMNKLGERTINIDCDVLQADGGTRAACISGSYLALKAAEVTWLNSGIIKESIVTDEIAAISAGILDNEFLLDLSYNEDCRVNMDFNFVLTKSYNIVEIQCSAEKKVVCWNEFESIYQLAKKGIDQMFYSFEQNKILNNKVQNSNAHITF